MTLKEVHSVYFNIKSKAVESKAGLIPQILQLQVILGRCHKSEDCAKSSAHISMCFYSQRGRGTSIRLLK